MKVLAITGTEIDLSTQNVPFLSNYTVVLINLTAGTLVVQESATSGSGFTTLKSLATNEIAEVTFNKQYIKVSTSATVYAIGN